MRRVNAGDQRDARIMRTYFHSLDSALFPGTVSGFSAAQINDLRRQGRTAITYLDVGAFMGRSIVRRELAGTLTRVKAGTTSLPMFLNGRNVQLPVLHVEGRLSGAATTQRFEFHVLDDPDNPILLRSRGTGSSPSLVRIKYPEPGTAPSTMERELAERRSAEIHGIYFAFGSAAIRA